MKQFKIFRYKYCDYTLLEKDINEFSEKHNVIDFKISSDNSYIIVVIMYTDGTKQVRC